MVNRMIGVAVVLAALAMVGLSRSHADSGPGGGGSSGSGSGGNNGLVKVEGTVVAVDPGASTVTIRRQDGLGVMVRATAATKIERNGRRVPLSAIRLNDRGQALCDPATKIATKIEAVGP